MILPLVKTIDILISHGCLDEIMRKSESEFVGPLFRLLKTEARNLSDIYRLFAIINVSISLMGTRHKEMVSKLSVLVNFILSTQIFQHLIISLPDNKIGPLPYSSLSSQYARSPVPSNSSVYRRAIVYAFIGRWIDHLNN